MPPRHENAADQRLLALQSRADDVTNAILDMDEDGLLELLDSLARKWCVHDPPRSFETIISNAFSNFDSDTSDDVDHADTGSYGLKFMDAKIHLKELEAVILYGKMKEMDMLDDLSIAAKIRRVLEMIYYAKKLVISTFRSKISLHERYDVDKETDERLSSYSLRFRWLDSQLNDMQKLLLYLLDICQERRYRKLGDSLFEPIIIDGHNTQSYKRVSTIESFVYSECEKEVQFEAFLQLTSRSGVATNVITQLTKSKDFQLPFLKVSRTHFSFGDCIYSCEDDMFYPYDSTRRVGDHIVCAKFFPDGALVCEDMPWHSIETPNIDRVFRYQGFTNDELLWFYVLAGRMLYNLNTHDGWTVIPFLLGLAGTGKSSITDGLIGSMYDRSMVGILGNNMERQFGLSAIVDSLIYVGPEIKKDFSLEQATFQSMVSGESITVSEKFKTAYSTTFLAPGWLSGNELPGWSDNSGSIRRRLVIFRFDKRVTNMDNELSEKMRREMPKFIVKANRAYRDMAGKHGMKNIWDVISSEFVEARDKSMANASIIDSFVRSTKVVYGDGGYISLPKFRMMLREYGDMNGFEMPKNLDVQHISGILQKYDISISRGEHEEDGQLIQDDFVYNIKEVTREKNMIVDDFI
jgi:hypothetical protein